LYSIAFPFYELMLLFIGHPTFFCAILWHCDPEMILSRGGKQQE
jgi:hypothetical protein